MLTKKEAAQYFGVHPKTVEKWCRKGILEKVKIDGSSTVRFRVSQVELLIQNSTRGVTVGPKTLNRKMVFA